MKAQLEKQTPFRYHVGLRVSSDGTTPDEITTLLGLQPHSTRFKGELCSFAGIAEMLNDRARAAITRHHKWCASFEPLTMTEPLNDCLLRVERHLARHSDALVSLAKDASIKLYIHAYPGSLPQPVDWKILERIRTKHPVGLDVSLDSALEAERPVDETRPKSIG